MKITYSLALIILVVAVTSAGRIPVKDDDSISNNPHGVLDSDDKRFPNQKWKPQMNNQQPRHKKQHHGFKDHAKPSHFHTTGSPDSEEVNVITSTEPESEDASINTTTVVPNTAETDVESESETSGNAISTTQQEPDDETTSANSEDVTSTANSQTEAVTESESENGSTVDTIGSSTVKSETSEANVTSTSADSQSDAETTATAKTWWQKMLFWQ